MYITIHSAVGAAAGQYIGNPAAAFAVGFALHLLLDAVPHGDEAIGKWSWFNTLRKRLVAAAILDFIGVFLMGTVWLYYNDLSLWPSILAGMAGGIAPDVLWGIHELIGTPVLKQYREFHAKFHTLFTKKRLTIKQGFLLQIPLLALLTWLIVKI